LTSVLSERGIGDEWLLRETFGANFEKRRGKRRCSGSGPRQRRSFAASLHIRDFFKI
jgi:hypothetical protein